MTNIIKIIQSSIRVKEEILSNATLLENIERLGNLMIKTFQNGGKILFCGNGGSAADAQHLAAELSGRFYIDRKPLPAEALHCNTSYLTAVANDYGYDKIFSRLITAIGQSGDLLIGLSTSGNSPNIINAFETARVLGITTVAFTGESGGNLKHKATMLINVPSGDTPRIQEAHITIGHILCEMVERELFAI